MRGLTATPVISILRICARTARVRRATTNASKKNRSAKLHQLLRRHRHCRCSSRKRARNPQRRWGSTRYNFLFLMAIRPGFILTSICARSAHVRNAWHNEPNPFVPNYPRVHFDFECCSSSELKSRYASHFLENGGATGCREPLSGVDFVFAA